jgi:SAM-dependent methyltransferase
MPPARVLVAPRRATEGVVTMTQTVNGHGAAVTTPGSAPAGGEGRLGSGVYEGPASLAAARAALRVALPEPSSKFSQDDEWCVVAQPDGSWREFRFHDYHHIFAVPGLYEKIFYDVLGCDSPRFMAGLLADALADAHEEAADVRALDLGAGNGIMAEELARIGVAHTVGVDILPEAAVAAERDRPGLYADYLVEDLTALGAEDSRRLERHRLNALTVVAALGFGDIPPAAFRTAYDHVAEGGWIVLTIKDAFLAAEDTTGFARMISDGMSTGALEVVRRERFRHRLATDASPLVYEGIVARKRGPLG